MTAQQTLETIRNYGGDLYADCGTLHYKGKPLAEDLRSAIRVNKPELLNLLDPPECEQTTREIEAAYHFLCEVERLANHWGEVEPVVRAWTPEYR